MASVQLPHFAAPFAFANDGTVRVVEQDSIEDIAACVYNIAACPVGSRIDLPTFGIPDPTFAPAPLDTAPLRAAVERWEPRAQLAVTEQATALDQAVRTITAHVGARDPQQ